MVAVFYSITSNYCSIFKPSTGINGFRGNSFLRKNRLKHNPDFIV